MEHQRSKSMETDATVWQSSARLQAAGSDELGQSCRVYCPPATGRVPFDWEDEPGKPKGSSSRLDVDIPPLCPSPAMQSARIMTPRHGQRRSKSKQSAGTAVAAAGGFHGCIPPLRFHLGRAMKRWM